MKFRYNIILSALISLAAGCSDDLMRIDMPTESDMEIDAVEAYLSLSVNRMTVSNGSSRAEGDDTADELIAAAENRIDDIWVFQFDASSGEQLIIPIYYRISDQSQLKDVKVLLKDGIQSHICVVANTRDSKWANGPGFSTYEELKLQSLPNPSSLLIDDITNEKSSDRKLIPMEGENKDVVVEYKSTVTVNVNKMYAKLKISFVELLENMSPYSIEINNIPYYCRVESLGVDLDEAQAAEYPDDEDKWSLKSFTTTDYKNEYVVYVPENLQGKTENNLENNKGTKVPDKASVLRITMSYNGEKPEYLVYPGGDNINNFNIKRNTIYKIKISIKTSSMDIHLPSANCFVVEPHKELYFEPYYRTEKGGGYEFSDYLNPEDPDQTIIENGEEKTITGDKVIAGIKIIWQTEQAIGDNSSNTNSEGDKIRFIKNEDYPIHSKIYVKANEAGNALIGAYNAKGEIIWSWHIWITESDPENVGKAVEYTTYRWDSNKIYSRAQGLKDYNDEEYYKRVPGYAIMNCNLGAMASSPYPDKFATYGLLYQWGRKDPFPQMKRETASEGYYNYDHVTARIYVYDNGHKLIDLTGNNGANDNEKYLFNRKLTSTVESLMSGREELTLQQKGIRYSIAHPTVFISPGYDNVNQGDWLPGHDEKLWGALPMEGKEFFKIDSSKRLWRTYGTEKSIFDPCPKGWRVPPGDLWLGLTSTGMTASCNNTGLPLTDYWEMINCADPDLQTTYNNYGYTMYMEDWRKGKTCYFPTQGSRRADGKPFHGGLCGNYHNATSDLNNRVNTLHFHKGPGAEQVNIFEPQQLYHIKAVAGPIRCVRDRK